MADKEILQSGNRVINRADGSQERIPFGSSTQAESAPSLKDMRKLPKSDAAVPTEGRGRTIDNQVERDTNGYPSTDVRYGGQAGSSTGQ